MERPPVRWFLELKGKDRGYVRRVENTGKDGEAIFTRQKPDISHLTDEELEILVATQKRRESAVSEKIEPSLSPT
ncbi:hypothetical protein FJ417_24665 [Mesorhizobium sp. B3-1-7]|uniref:hypothetical protein n=1 Tax=Mesorhizobium sp. B3-1-7 TaxID=2589894 RepID=UPI001128E2BD|nr:hypothetical protein [Mesorhizobium sp. B3-1-7]TPI54746.1 hypothetical protein FJ417_24665 [Mesorhizobium sp. B3-1-7]